MSVKNCDISININELNMDNCEINISMSDGNVTSDEGTPLFIRNGDDFVRSIQVSAGTSGARVEIVRNIPTSYWIISVVTADGRVRANLVGTNLYLTLPSGDDKYVRITPLGGYDNEQQYFDITKSMDGSFTLSRGGVFISTENQEVTEGSYLVAPTPGETVYTAVFGFTPV